jgi:hypothetical protein
MAGTEKDNRDVSLSPRASIRHFPERWRGKGLTDRPDMPIAPPFSNK